MHRLGRPRWVGKVTDAITTSAKTASAKTAGAKDTHQHDTSQYDSRGHAALRIRADGQGGDITTAGVATRNGGDRENVACGNVACGNVAARPDDHGGNRPGGRGHRLHPQTRSRETRSSWPAGYHHIGFVGVGRRETCLVEVSAELLGAGQEAVERLHVLANDHVIASDTIGETPLDHVDRGLLAGHLAAVDVPRDASAAGRSAAARPTSAVAAPAGCHREPSPAPGRRAPPLARRHPMLTSC